MPTTPPSVTALPAVPDRADRATFSTRATNYFDALKNTYTPQIEALADNAFDNATEAAASATAATTNGAAQVTLAAAQVALATTQATNAAGSASSAATQATNAANQVTLAAAQVTLATTQAGNAATSATAAAGSATAALGYLNDFKGRYYGAFASNPTLDPLGAAMRAGDLYYNTAIPEMRVYSGSAWVAAYIPAEGYLTTGAIGTTVQAYDADLTSWAGIAPSAKQDALVSGTSIKTVNSTSLLGSGDVAVPGPAWVLLSTVTASASATLEFTTGLNSTYDEYVILGHDLLRAGTSQRPLIQMYVGGAWKTGASAYESIYCYGTALGQQSWPGVILGDQSTAAAGMVVNFECRFRTPTASKLHVVDVTGSMRTDTSVRLISTAGICTGPSAALTGIRFLFEGNTITSGKMYLYGIKKT